jgi:hypothetical protein
MVPDAFVTGAVRTGGHRLGEPRSNRAPHTFDERLSERRERAAAGQGFDGFGGGGSPARELGVGRPGRRPLGGVTVHPPEVGDGDMGVGALQDSFQRARVLPPGDPVEPLIGWVEQVEHVHDGAEFHVLELV